MKKVIKTLVVSLVVASLMVVPTFAMTVGMATVEAPKEGTITVNPDGSRTIVKYTSDGDWYEELLPATTSSQVTTLTPAPAQPVVTPVVPTATQINIPATDAAFLAQVQSTTMTYVTNQFYGGDANKALADIENYANLCKQAYPQIMQALQAAQK